MSPASLTISIGIRRRWHAKVVFMIGMYWCARSPETLRTRIRDCRPVGVEEEESGATVVEVLEVSIPE